MSDLVKDLRIKAGMIMMCERIPFGSDAALMEQAANEIEQLQQRNAELTAQVKQLQQELTLSTDQNDLLLDEFIRVKHLTDNEEIHGLCERAHVRMRQKVSVIDRNFKQAEEIKQLKSQVEKLKERNRKLDVDLLRALFYVPSSPVSAKKAYEIEVWYGKFKQVVLAAKAGE